MDGPLVILLVAEGWQARWLAVSLALTAAAHGDPVQLALFGGALRAFADGRFDDGAPPEVAGARVGSLAAMLEEGRDLGLRVVACDTAVRLAGVDPAAAAARLTVTTLPSLWAEGRRGRLLAL
jgi:hypothetical protein